MPGQDLTDEANAIIAKIEAKAADLKAKRLANPPRPFDLNKASERRRLLTELIGYVKVSLNHGADTEGRQYALCALKQLLQETLA